MNSLKSDVREVLDYPKKGINFYDITTLLKKPDQFKKVIDLICEEYREKTVDYVVSIESRGFILGSAIAYRLGAGFIPVRKKGKLPAKTISARYSLEYGEDTLEIHSDALEEGKNILIVDDILATGGTVKATISLCETSKVTIIGLAFFAELTFLNGRSKLDEYPIFTVLKYDH